MLSDADRGHYRIRNRGKKDVGKWYSDSQKMEAVKFWLISGSLVQTSAALGIPLQTIKHWRYSQWWDNLVRDIRTEDTFKLSSKLKSIAEKALDVTLDRLENGDYIYSQKTGEMVRKPVVMRDAHLVAIGLTDRAQALDKKPREEENNQKTQDRLIALAEAFAKFANKAQRVEIIDATFDNSQTGQLNSEGIKHAVHDQREEGLQEGSEVGKDQAQITFEGSSGKGPSPQGVNEGR